MEKLTSKTLNNHVHNLYGARVSAQDLYALTAADVDALRYALISARYALNEVGMDDSRLMKTLNRLQEELK